MGFHPLTWYCRPDANGVWATITDSTFGAYTPCGIDSLVVGTSHLVLLCLCFYRIWLIKKGRKVQRYSLRSNNYNHLLGLLAGYCTAEPLFRLVMGISIFDLDGQTGLLPFEDSKGLTESDRDNYREWILLAGKYQCCISTSAHLQFRSVVCVLLILPCALGSFLLDCLVHLTGDELELATSCIRLLFGVSLLVYIPHLNPYPGYIPVWNESLDDTEYEAPPGGEHSCPERHASLFSRICFGWMTPLMQQGYKRPIIEEDVWKLDTWDQTETLIKKFAIC
ncbi:hypothetical protein Vadar_032648 [Vaccinium darrowii]|uniref:Uncharacterized protein n=1 Tax=Vaccinium darrowii TaxID=229202 RepID=A0ACB7XE57_9ERIC|nr:hypothetical protein Vadar_032648 [Vaccinium darrowii]